MSTQNDTPEVAVCDRCGLIAYPLNPCGGDRLCGACVCEHASGDDPCPTCSATLDEMHDEFSALFGEDS